MLWSKHNLCSILSSVPASCCCFPQKSCCYFSCGHWIWHLSWPQHVAKPPGNIWKSVTKHRKSQMWAITWLTSFVSLRSWFILRTENRKVPKKVLSCQGSLNVKTIKPPKNEAAHLNWLQSHIVKSNTLNQFNKSTEVSVTTRRPLHSS